MSFRNNERQKRYIKARAGRTQSILSKTFPNLFKNKNLSRLVSKHRQNMLKYILSLKPKTSKYNPRNNYSTNNLAQMLGMKPGNFKKNKN